MESDKKRKELSKRAYDYVRERILTGEYTFGTSISRRDLAANLGMSLVPVNEAMSRLENEYLIENAPRVGTKVRIPSPEDIRGFWAVREGLETQAARLYARVATKKEHKELTALAQELDRMHEAMHESDPDATEPDPKVLYRWRSAHMRFHMRIAEGTKLHYLTGEIAKNQLLVFNWFYDHQLYGGRKLPAHWHEQLARSLAEGSEEAADAAMRKHLHNKLEELMQTLERFLLMDESSLARWKVATVQKSTGKSSKAGKKQ
ncbi:MAG TPA: GntR family transcriptional regulator [Acidobacteriaceae bacterium]|nr:GntR family transcriptional regulator [Acidobacteriaceae bacterium]